MCCVSVLVWLKDLSSCWFFAGGKHKLHIPPLLAYGPEHAGCFSGDVAIWTKRNNLQFFWGLTIWSKTCSVHQIALSNLNVQRYGIASSCLWVHVCIEFAVSLYGFFVLLFSIQWLILLVIIANIVSHLDFIKPINPVLDVWSYSLCILVMILYANYNDCFCIAKIFKSKH